METHRSWMRISICVDALELLQRPSTTLKDFTLYLIWAQSQTSYSRLGYTAQRVVTCIFSRLIHPHIATTKSLKSTFTTRAESRVAERQARSCAAAAADRAHMPAGRMRKRRARFSSDFCPAGAFPPQAQQKRRMCGRPIELRKVKRDLYTVASRAARLSERYVSRDVGTGTARGPCGAILSTR
ncbi:hypothetical protein IE81DRAFT_19814 [Ceraceosorus guamensis]|uniref:Uncharacterized protein n=1 Tax=Ceraceosorus guamensis TaxID=1522189 RepID=A0A316W6P8_9BASI|nr:hypothetical protein IE81DRAFT_19814 [Ceraceosorus guamensis]PWN44431.1 hypothetical protein IE81DRAFT_19814 [Ceraceosorus guamensis]